MSFDLMRIGTRGTLGHQQSLQVTGNNIANINTPGYVREKPVYREAEFEGGIRRVEVERILDKFTQREYWRDTARYGYAESFLKEASKIDTYFGSEENSLSHTLSTFFDSIQDLNDNPSSLTQRELVLGQAETTVAQIRDTASYLFEQEKEFNQKLELNLHEANNIIEAIADLNAQLTFIKPSAVSGEAHTILNERDEKIRELSEYLNVSVIEGDNGLVRVHLATGQALVLEDGTYNLMALQGNPDPDRPELVARIQQHDKVLTQHLSNVDVGGKLGGLLAYRSDVLEPAQMRVGQLAIAFADSFNEVHRQGFTLDGQTGLNFFSFEQDYVGFPSSENADPNLQLQYHIEEGFVKELPANSFTVVVESATEYRILPLDSQGNVVGDPTNYPLQVMNDPLHDPADTYGLSFNFPAGTTAGDQFVLKPTKNVAQTLKVDLSEAEHLAMASAAGALNDNSNGLALAELQRAQVVKRDGSSSSSTMLNLNEGFGRIVSDVGSKVSQGRVVERASGAMLQQSKQMYESVSGVSLDEEAANLLQYEQAYNASAKIITVAQQIFDTLLAAVR